MDLHEIASQNTCWAFVASSVEARHLFDIVFGIDVLRKRGVPDSHIFVFLDHPAPNPHLQPFGIQNIHPLSELAVRLAGLPKHDYVVLVATGHGGFTGLGHAQATPVPPETIIGAARSVPGIKVAVLIIGQCFGGVFNLTDARKEPEVVLLGATNLNPSLSAGVSLTAPVLQVNGTPGLQTWLANIFLLHFFFWLRAPIDVDGDGIITLIDGYKYAGCASNEHVRKAKANLYLKARVQAAAVEKAQAAGATGLALQGHQDALQETLDQLHLHQEPWMLHAVLGRHVRFS